MNLIDAAATYLNAGLCAIPARADQKRPTLATWKTYQTRLPTEIETSRWFEKTQAVCLICGSVSGNLEMLDFDLAGDAFESWWSAVQAVNPKLLDRLVVEQSPSKGWHVVYRCEKPVSGNLKLAQRRQPVEGPEEVTFFGKFYKPRHDANGTWHVILTMIETRGEGGLFLCAPSPGYELAQGDFTGLPVLTESERELLLQTAWQLNQYVPEVASPPSATTSTSLNDGRPGDDFNSRGDVREIILRHGWSLAQGGDNEYWRRPGKSSGWSATFRDNVFYVFSSSAAPFEPNQAYSPFSVYTHLEHGGDFAAAASALRSQGYGDDPPPETDVDLSNILQPLPNATKDRKPVAKKPDPIPDHLLRIPGFVGDVIDFSLYAARYPNLPMAFCAAMALQSFLCSRKVREEGGLRPNLYLLALADSGAGKGFPRKVNSHILNAVGMGGAIGNQISSGQGLEDAILDHRKMIFQTDEVDHLVRSLSSSKESYHSMLLSMLLTLYSEADQIHTARTKVRVRGRNEELVREVDQPGLVILGTGTPDCFFESLSTRLLTNGLFSRSIVVAAEDRGARQRPHDVSEMPQHLIETAQWWKDYNPAPPHPETGQKPNLDDAHPTPAIVPFAENGYELLDTFALHADQQYKEAKNVGDRVRAILWTRAYENATRMALVYACSRNHLDPKIDSEVATWAAEFTGHLIRQMLFMASQHVAENPFHAECLKLVRKLRECGGQMTRGDLIRAMHCKAMDLDQMVSTLEQQGDITTVRIGTQTKPALGYQLL